MVNHTIYFFSLKQFRNHNNKGRILGMEHKSLTLEHDKNLIDKILEDINTRYIILFLYIVRNDLFKDLSDAGLVESYERVLILDDVFKSNMTTYLDKYFIETYIDLGLIKNIRSVREFEQKPDDFILRLGEETVTIEKNTISMPDDSLFLMIHKKFKSLSRRNFNLALTRLKSVRCEKSNLIHSLIYEIGEHDYVLSDDIYYVLDQYGNIYQAIKIEVTIEGFHQRLVEIKEKIETYIEVFEPKLNSKAVLKKIKSAIEQSQDVIQYLKDEKVELSDKFNFNKIDTSEEIFTKWKSQLESLINLRDQLEQIDKRLIELKRYYTGKNKTNSYLEFIEKVSFNEDEIVDKIQTLLIELRKELVRINEVMSTFTMKELKLLNLDYERLIILGNDD
ncbi:hypothetical protein LCGC14_1454010 [marine sediment metagenome]|uniref:Uncharacterized protein n=1 Tax=marine sediment metagenome TaxID=412755 RepID=A0A0F9JGY8_9ZZZZ